MDKLKTTLKVRKTQNRKTLEAPQKNVTGMMTNYSECNGSKGNYQRELNNKVITALNKSKTGTQRMQSQTKNGKGLSKLQEIPKPKTFAENLMSMLAKQALVVLDTPRLQKVVPGITLIVEILISLATKGWLMEINQSLWGYLKLSNQP